MDQERAGPPALDDFSGLDPSSLAPAGVAPLASAIRQRIPEIIRSTASNDMYQLGSFWLLALVLWGLGVAVLSDGDSAGLGTYVVQLLITIALLVGGPLLCWRRYQQSYARLQGRWDRAYGRTDYELRATGLPALIVDLDVWQQILDATDGSLLAVVFEHKVKGAEDCLLHACCYWRALHEYMFGAELVQSRSVWEGHHLRAELGRGGGQRHSSVELFARLAAICDYFSADLEIMPELSGWRDYYGALPLHLRPELQQREHEAARAQAWLKTQQTREEGPGRDSGW
ncbi:hypothetical protein IT575_05350 [bacterium]|nr:hypothetical protein [bacterium]